MRICRLNAFKFCNNSKVIKVRIWELKKIRWKQIHSKEIFFKIYKLLVLLFTDTYISLIENYLSSTIFCAQSIIHDFHLNLTQLINLSRLSLSS